MIICSKNDGRDCKGSPSEVGPASEQEGFASAGLHAVCLGTCATGAVLLGPAPIDLKSPSNGFGVWVKVVNWQWLHRF
jgi:hypothetical protein